MNTTCPRCRNQRKVVRVKHTCKTCSKITSYVVGVDAKGKLVTPDVRCDYCGNTFPIPSPGIEADLSQQEPCDVCKRLLCDPR